MKTDIICKYESLLERRNMRDSDKNRSGKERKKSKTYNLS